MRIELPAGGDIEVQLPQPRDGALVRIEPVDGGWMAYTFMNEQGLVRTFSLPMGKYRLTAVRGQTTLREKVVELQEPGLLHVDWSDLND